MKLRSLALLPLSLLGSALLAQNAADDAIFGAIRISSLEDLANSVAAFADRIEPGSGAQAAQLPLMAGAFGLATDREILALIIDPAKSGQPFAFVLPALDPEQMKSNPAINFQPVAGSSDRFQITLPNGLPLFATFLGDRLVASPLEAGLDAVLPALEAGADLRQLRAAGGQLALSLSADRLYAAYKPMLDFMLMGMRSQLAAAASGPQAANPADVLGSALGSLGEVQDYSLSISIQADHLDFRSSVTATPDTQTAALLSAGRGPVVALPAAYDENSAVFGTFSARPSPEFWAAYNRFVGDLVKNLDTSGSTAASEALTKTVNDFAAIWDGTGSVAMFSPNETMSGSGSAGITDSAKALALLRSLPELEKSMASLNQGQGLATEITLGEEEAHGEARLLDVTQTSRATTPEMEVTLARMQNLGLDKFTATYGVAPTRLVYAMGNASRTEAKRLLDAPAATSTTITPAAYGLPAQSTVFMAVSLPRYLGWISRMSGDMPFSFDPEAGARPPGLALTADLVDGRADFRLRLHTTEIIALKDSFSPKPGAVPADPADPEAPAAEAPAAD